MLEGLNNYLSEQKFYMLRNATAPLNDSELKHILSLKVRSEKVAIKDIKLRTFIAEGDTRDDLAAHVYDITYGTVQADIDNLVIIDDSSSRHDIKTKYYKNIGPIASQKDNNRVVFSPS